MTVQSAGCEDCGYANQNGHWPGQTTHCRKCHYTWSMNTKQAHCTFCHRHFTSPSGFDQHLKTGTDGFSIFHLDPATLKHPLVRNAQGAWQYPTDDHFSALTARQEDEFTTPLDLDTPEPAASVLSWLPAPRL